MYKQSIKGRQGKGTLEEWIEKWSFILHNDKELSQVAGYVALKQLNEIISQDFHFKKPMATSIVAHC